MKWLPVLLGLLLVPIASTAYAEVGQNYDLEEDHINGIATWTSHPERIMDGTWQNYVLTTENQKVIFNSNSIGSFVYDIDTCSYSIYENGYDGANIIPSVSSVATENINGVWQNMEVNNESCQVDVTPFEDGIFLTSTKLLTESITNGTSVNGTAIVTTVETKFVDEITLNINSGIKETFKVWNPTNENQLGISQTVHTGETITIAEQTIDIASFNGQSFDRQFLEDNQAEIFEIASNLNYDFDEGFESLSDLNIIFDGDYKVNLDYANGNFVNYLEIDPTLSNVSGTVNTINTSLTSSSSSCPSPSSISSGLFAIKLAKKTSVGSECKRADVYFDVSTISSSASILDVEFTYNVNSIHGNGGVPSIDWTELLVKPNTQSVQPRWNEISDNTVYVSGDTNSQTVGTGYVKDLGSSADSNLETLLQNGETWFGIGGKPTSEVRTSSPTKQTVFNGLTLSVTYSIPSVPDSITDLSASFNSPNVDLTFSTPSDGGSAITSFKVYRDTGSGYSLYDTVSGSSLTSYQDVSPVNGVINYYKINAVNGVGEALDSNVGSDLVGIPPDAPTGLTSTIQDPNANPLDVLLQFSSPTNVGSGTLTGFEIWRDGTLITTIGLVNSYTDTVTEGTHSHYVKAVSTHGTSVASNTVNITTPTYPDPITDLSANVLSDVAIDLSWSVPNDGGSAIVDYDIIRDGVTIATVNTNSYSDSGLTGNTQYVYEVFVRNNVGYSTISNQITPTTGTAVSGTLSSTQSQIGATIQITPSLNVTAGTPTPTFSTIQLYQDGTLIKEVPYGVLYHHFTDESAHNITISVTDPTHWNTPTISSAFVSTSAYAPSWENNVAYNVTRASNTFDLTVNRDIAAGWDLDCEYRTGTQAAANTNGTHGVGTNMWAYQDSQSISDGKHVYVTCTEGGATVLSFTSYGPNIITGGLNMLDCQFGDFLGAPAAVLFVVLVAGLFTGRTANTGILVIMALIGVLGFIGFMAIDEATWGFVLLAGCIGLFVGRRFL